MNTVVTIETSYPGDTNRAITSRFSEDHVSAIADCLKSHLGEFVDECSVVELLMGVAVTIEHDVDLEEEYAVLMRPFLDAAHACRDALGAWRKSKSGGAALRVSK